jgi:hypothetical protein
MKKVEWVVLLPPSLAFAVIHIVVDRHFTTSASSLVRDHLQTIELGAGDLFERLFSGRGGH